MCSTFDQICAIHRFPALASSHPTHDDLNDLDSLDDLDDSVMSDPESDDMSDDDYENLSMSDDCVPSMPDVPQTYVPSTNQANNLPLQTIMEEDEEWSLSSSTPVLPAGNCRSLPRGRPAVT